METAEPVYYSSATAIAEAIRRRHIGCEEVTRAHLARIERVNPQIHAVVALQAEAAIDRAQRADAELTRGAEIGPLHGVPMTIKDTIDTAGLVSTAGTLGRRDFVPDKDATVVAKLQAAGAILLGKTNTPELTMHGYTENLVYPRTLNPYDRDRSPMGSSGGAAAIVAAGGSAFDIGSDTGGSVRIPAHACGVCGLQPTSGRVSRSGHILDWKTFDQSLTTLGPIARDVEDLATVLSVISGSDGIDPFARDAPLADFLEVKLERLRVAFYTDNGIATPTPATVETVRRAARTLESTGAAVEEKPPPSISASLDVFGSIVGLDGGFGVHRILKESGTVKAAPYLAWAMDRPEQHTAKRLSNEDIATSFNQWHQMMSEVTHFFAADDLILCPVSAIPAPTHDTPMEDLERSMLTYTAAYSVLGWPAAVVRAGWSEDGLPIGVQIVGKPWQEAHVLAAAQQIQDASGGFRAPTL